MLYFRPCHHLKERLARLVLIPSGTKSSREPVIAPLSPEVGCPFLLRIKRRPHQPLRLNCDAEDCHSAVCGAEDRTGTSCCLHACPGDVLLLYLTALYDFTRRKNGSAFLSFIHSYPLSLVTKTRICFLGPLYYKYSCVCQVAKSSILSIKPCEKEASFDARLVGLLPCG